MSAPGGGGELFRVVLSSKNSFDSGEEMGDKYCFDEVSVIG